MEWHENQFSIKFELQMVSEMGPIPQYIKAWFPSLINIFNRLGMLPAMTDTVPDTSEKDKNF